MSAQGPSFPYPFVMKGILTIYAYGAEEGSSVLDVWIARGKQHGETDDAEYRNEDVAVASLLCAVCNIANCNCYHGSDSIRRYGEQICRGGFVT